MKQPVLGTWECTFITPQMAADMLTRNVHRNRPLNKGRIKLYVEAMRRGDWPLTHQGIAFKVDELHDGQHRLTAIVQVGIGQWIWVYRYPVEQPSALHQIDRGASRTDAQAAYISGRDLAASDSSYLRVVAFGRSTFEYTRKLDAAEWLRIVDKYQPVVEWLHEIGFRSKRRGFSVAAILGAFGRASFHLPNSIVARCADVYLSGQPAGPHESAALRLRELALQLGKNSDRYGRRDVYLKACAAIKSFAAGKPVKRLIATESPDEPFPLPE